MVANQGNTISDHNINEFKFFHLHGIEKSDRMVRIAMTDMMLHDDGHTNIRNIDALLNFENYPDLVAIKDDGNTDPAIFDIVVTNSPFGSTVKKESLAMLGQFELVQGRKSLPLEVLGLERSVQLLKPNGRMAIVLPEHLIKGKSNQYVREWLFSSNYSPPKYGAGWVCRRNIWRFVCNTGQLNMYTQSREGSEFFWVDVFNENDSCRRMIRASFLSTPDRRELEACVRSHREDHGIARRANAILLLDDGESCVQIAKFLYVDDDTIRNWYKTYLEGGWDALCVDGWKGGQSRMTSVQETELCGWLDGRFCRSTVEIRAHISSRYDLDYSHSGCLKLLARLGFEYRKPKALPRVSCAEKQVEFIDMYERLMTGLSDDRAWRG